MALGMVPDSESVLNVSPVILPLVQEIPSQSIVVLQGSLTKPSDSALPFMVKFQFFRKVVALLPPIATKTS
jgi:hypothetical protein